MKLRKHILSVGAALLALFMALCLSSCQTGNGPSGGETQRDTTGNVTPPVAVRVIGTLPQVEGRSGVCVLNVTEVLNDGTDAPFELAGKIDVELPDGSTWNFTPGEGLSFKYQWRGDNVGGKDAPEVGDMVYLVWDNGIWPDNPSLSGAGKMYPVGTDGSGAAA